MEEKQGALPLFGGQILIEKDRDAAQDDKLFGTMQDCGMKICVFCTNALLNADEDDKDLTDKYIEAAAGAHAHALSVYIAFELLPESADRTLAALHSTASLFCRHNAADGWIISVSDEKYGREKYTELLHAAADSIRKSDGIHDILLDCKDIPDSIWKYDFNALKSDFSGFGLSFVPIRDISQYARRRYNAAFSAACDMLRSAAAGKPFWITGLQSGNNGGEDGFSPSRAEISQWVWVALGQGASGVLFDSLNLPLSGRKAGGEALLNLTGEASRKTLVVRDIIASLNENQELFIVSETVENPITVLYSNKSLYSEESSGTDPAMLPDAADKRAAIKPCQSMRSAMAAYEILMENGARPGFCEIGGYDWTSDDYRGQCVIVSSQEIIPSEYYENFREFVKKGGKLIVEGRSFYFDENNNCNFSKAEFPLADVFGGRAKEFDAIQKDRKIKVTENRFWVHRWYGLLKNDASGETLPLIRNKYGRGKVLWIPSMIILGAINSGHRSALSKLLVKELADIAAGLPLRFRRRRSGVSLQLLKSPDGYISIVSNKGRHRRKVRFRTAYKVGKLLYSDIRYERRAKAKNRKIKLRSQHTAAVLWKS